MIDSTFLRPMSEVSVSCSIIAVGSGKRELTIRSARGQTSVTLATYGLIAVVFGGQGF